MTLYSLIFYVLAVIILISTALAITRRNLVHASIYLIISFFGSAILYYLLGAPYLAVLEVIIYAGAIMVLFLFIVMMLRADKPLEQWRPLRQLLPAAVLGSIYLPIIGLLVHKDPGSQVSLRLYMVRPRDFGHFLFQRYWFAVELIALLLFVALIGVLYLGKTSGKSNSD